MQATANARLNGTYPMKPMTATDLTGWVETLRKRNKELTSELAMTRSRVTELARRIDAVSMTVNEMRVAAANTENGHGALPETPKSLSWVTVDNVLAAVAHVTGISPDRVTAACDIRGRPVSRARSVFAYVLRKKLGMTFMEIGEALGRRDHTTAMYHVEKCTKKAELRAGAAEVIDLLWAKEKA